MAVQEKAKTSGRGLGVKLLLVIAALVVFILIAARVIGYGNLGHAAGTIYRMLGG